MQNQIANSEIIFELVDNQLMYSSLELIKHIRTKNNTKYNHADILRKIKSLLKNMEQKRADSNFALSYYLGQDNAKTPYYLMSKDGVVFLLNKLNTPTCNEFTWRFIDDYNNLKDNQTFIKFRSNDIEHQKLSMHILQNNLIEDEKSKKINYIKANTVVNKITSTVHGYPKLKTKNDMTLEELETRQKVLDKYIKTYELVKDNSCTNKILYTMLDSSKLLN